MINKQKEDYTLARFGLGWAGGRKRVTKRDELNEIK